VSKSWTGLRLLDDGARLDQPAARTLSNHVAARGRGKERTTMASKESERVSRYYAAVLQPPQPDSLVTNAQWDLLTGEPGGVDYLEIDAGGVPGVWEVPHGITEDAPAILCFHGGGYVGGSMFTHRKMFAHLAKGIGARALVIDYTLVPAGGVYPRPVSEGVTAYQWLLDNPVGADRVAFVGDSAGAGLAITVQLSARSEGLPLPAAAMLISPWTDLEGVGESLDTNHGKDVLFTKGGLPRWRPGSSTATTRGIRRRCRCMPISAASGRSTSRWAITSFCSTTAVCLLSMPGRPGLTSGSMSSRSAAQLSDHRGTCA
jgi:hypothetical protein